MNWIQKLSYNIFKSVIKIYLYNFLEFKIWGKSNIPPGPKIFCSNHFSSTDPFYVMTIMDEPIHMIIGPAFSVPFFKIILKFGKQINAMPELKDEVIPTAIKYLKNNESIYIFPEGDLGDQKSLGYFYSGIARIYLQNPVPIIPIGILSPIRYVKEAERTMKIDNKISKISTVLTGKYYVNIGKPLRFPSLENTSYTHDDTELITSTIKQEIEMLINDIKTNKFWS